MLEVVLEGPGQAWALGKAIGIASQQLSCAPHWPGRASLALDRILSQGESCGMMEETTCLKLWVLPFPEAITKQSSRNF